ncbi:MAG TPA: energy transducer TonB [Candidatus Limnocylindria bacterium]|nr:energy transducer TonB [Candidatus Limnocylindria bacterium]
MSVPVPPSVPVVAIDDPAKVTFAVPVLNVTSITNRVDLVAFPPRRDTSSAPAKSGPVRWEGSVSKGVSGGYFPRPDYPREAIIKHESGTVEVLVEVAEDGVVTTAEVQSSSGSNSLDRQAVQFLKRKWRWPAGEQRKYIVPVEFSLQQ